MWHSATKLLIEKEKQPIIVYGEQKPLKIFQTTKKNEIIYFL